MPQLQISNPLGFLGKFSFLGRNMFKGSEILELTFQGSFFNLANDASNSDNFFNGWEVLSGASLRFPRIFFQLIHPRSFLNIWRHQRTSMPA